jgi:hypothetical protein
MVTDTQRRVLEIGLRRIETEVAWIEELLGWTYEGLLASIVEDLGDSKREQLRARIHQARGLISGLREALGLRPERVPKSGWIAGHLAHLWVIAEECQSRYLRGYGAVAPGLAEIVDPPARRLAELLLAMQRITREGRVEEPVGDAERLSA